MKKILIVLFLGSSLVLIGLLLWSSHKHKPLPYGITNTDLKAAEVNEAVNILKRERLMWANLNDLSGHIVVEFGRTNYWNDPSNHIKFDCDISIHKVDRADSVKSRYNDSYEVTFTNEEEQWSIVTDGTEQNTVVKFSSPENNPKTHGVHGMRLGQVLEIPTLLLLEKTVLIASDLDPLNPKGGFQLTDILPTWTPWRNPTPDNAPHSYVFRDAHQKMNELAFTRGHVSRWVKRGDIIGAPEEDVKIVSFSDLVEINECWVPRQIDWQYQDFRWTIQFTN